MADKKKRKHKISLAAVLCRILGTLILVAVIGSLSLLSVPKKFGYQVYDVMTGSMEPVLPAGSLAYVTAIEPMELEEGDIAAFVSGGSVVLHRVVSNHKVERYLITKGDANEKEDIDEVSYAAVRGKVARHIPVLGGLLMILATTLGKVLTLCLILCGVLLHVLAGRLE